jgi:hypothetical protein
MSSKFDKFKFKLSQWYIGNMIGAACNSWIPPKNFHAGSIFTITIIALYRFAGRAKGNRSLFYSLCLQDLRIACNTDLSSNKPLREVNSEKNQKWRRV